MNVLQPQRGCRLRTGLNGPPRVPHHRHSEGPGPLSHSEKEKKKTRQSGLCLFSIVMPKDYSNSAILFQKDCLAAFHTVGETAGSKQSSVLSASAVPPLPESQFAPMACQAFPAPDEGGSSGREELAVLSRGSSLSPR